jgi:hypothetical protein
MTRALSLLLAVLVAVIAGCGGKDSSASKKDAYVAEFNQTSQTLERTLTGIRQDLRAETSGAEIAAKLDESATALNKAAERLRALSPPQDVRGAHDKIVTGLGELAAVFSSSAGAARANDVQKLTSALENIDRSEGARRIRAAQEELRRKGYDVRAT